MAAGSEVLELAFHEAAKGNRRSLVDLAGGGPKPHRDEARPDLPTRYRWIFQM
jgi:hypothetical protein